MVCQQLSAESGSKTRKFWVKVIEFCLQFVLENSSYNVGNLVGIAVNLLRRNSDLVADNCALVRMAVSFLMRLVETKCRSPGNVSWIANLVVNLGRSSRGDMFEVVASRLVHQMSSCLTQFEVAMSEAISDISENRPSSSNDCSSDWNDQYDYCDAKRGRVCEPYIDMIQVILQIFKRYPRLGASLVETPDIFRELGAIGILVAYENNTNDDRKLHLKSCELVATVTEIPEFRSKLISKKLLEMIINSPLNGQSALMSLYVACLLLSDCHKMPEVVVKRVALTADFIREKCEFICPHFPPHQSLLPLLEMAQCCHTHDVAAFALYCHNLFCNFRFHLRYYQGRCPQCLIKMTEITLDVLNALYILPDIQQDMKELIQKIVSCCEKHEGNHLK